jgi:hypothetical protein
LCKLLCKKANPEGDRYVRNKSNPANDCFEKLPVKRLSAFEKNTVEARSLTVTFTAQMIDNDRGNPIANLAILLLNKSKLLLKSGRKYNKIEIVESKPSLSLYMTETSLSFAPR